jgi:hypothetical protein
MSGNQKIDEGMVKTISNILLIFPKLGAEIQNVYL